MPRQRLGVALLIPQPLATQIDGLRRGLGDPALGRVPPHLTLVPPVNVAERDLGHTLALLRAAAAASQPFTLELGPVATFHPVTPVCYLAVSGATDKLRALRERVFRAPLHRELTHPFAPHVTVADSMDEARIAPTVVSLASFAAVVAFDRVHLLAERRDDERGRVWDAIADATFGQASIVGRGGLPLEISVHGRPDPEAAALLTADGSGEGTPFAVTARRDGAVVAAAWGWTVGGHLEIADMVVVQAARGEGIGRHVLAAVESLAARRDCTALGIAGPGDGPAAALLSGTGWVPVGAPTPAGHRRWERRL